MADRLASRQLLGKWANIVISALITAGAAGVLFSKNSQTYAYVTGGLSVASLVLNAYLKDLDPGALAQQHREAGSDVWNIREGYLSLLADTLDPKIDLGALRARRDDLQTKLHKIYQGAPQTGNAAYAEAQDDLKNKEALTFSEAELDLLLPTSLRRSAREVATDKLVS